MSASTAPPPASADKASSNDTPPSELPSPICRAGSRRTTPTAGTVGCRPWRKYSHNRTRHRPSPGGGSITDHAIRPGDSVLRPAARYRPRRGLPNYLGHYGLREVCGICPVRQIGRWSAGKPTAYRMLRGYGMSPPSSRRLVVSWSWTSRSGRQPRYYLQHTLGFQVHDERDIGWKDGPR
jgi:hypothetical protein